MTIQINSIDQYAHVVLFITLYKVVLTFNGTVSQTAHVQVINQKWSDVFKFVLCETKWRQQAEDNPHSHGGRRNNSCRKQFFFNSGNDRKKEREKSRRKNRLQINIYKSWLQAKLEATYSSASAR